MSIEVRCPPVLTLLAALVASPQLFAMDPEGALGDVPQLRFQTDLTAFPDAWSFLLGQSCWIDLLGSCSGPCQADVVAMEL